MAFQYGSMTGPRTGLVRTRTFEVRVPYLEVRYRTLGTGRYGTVPGRYGPCILHVQGGTKGGGAGVEVGTHATHSRKYIYKYVKITSIRPLNWIRPIHEQSRKKSRKMMIKRSAENMRQDENMILKKTWSGRKKRIGKTRPQSI